MVDHHTVLFVLGVALGTTLHAAVTHYKVPVLMVARAAVETAKKAAIDAFEELSDDEIPEEDFADPGSQDAPGPDGHDGQIALQPCPLAIIKQSPTTQLMLVQPSAPQLPTVQPTVVRRIQHWVAAGPPTLRFDGLAAWHSCGQVPMLDHCSGRSAGCSSNARRRAAWAGGKVTSGVTAFKLRCSWAHASVSTAAFVAAAAVIGVSCFWWGREREPAQQQDSSCSPDIPAVLKTILNSRQPPSISGSSKSTGSERPQQQCAIYLPHVAGSLRVSSDFLQQLPQVEQIHSSSNSYDSEELTSDELTRTAATKQLKMFQQQHLGVSLHQQTRLDRDLSMLEGLLQATPPGHSSTDSRTGYLAAWIHSMDEYLSEEVLLAEALVGL